MHGMKFDVTTGCFAGTSDRLIPFPARIVDGKKKKKKEERLLVALPLE